MRILKIFAKHPQSMASYHDIDPSKISSLRRCLNFVASRFGCRYKRRTTFENECHNQAAKSGMVCQCIGHTPVFQRSEYPGGRSPYCRRRVGRCVYRIQV